jgi:hypothetical protein
MMTLKPLCRVGSIAILAAVLAFVTSPASAATDFPTKSGPWNTES